MVGITQTTFYMSNRDIVEKFYQAFAGRDVEGMLRCYHEEIEFEDPAFGKLTGEKARNMWRMLLSGNKSNLQVTYSNIQTNGDSGSAQWIARYEFGPSGKKIVNEIASGFEFKDGLIIRHHDHFDLYRWARQAFGLMGFVIGWTTFFRKNLQRRTGELLERYSQSRK
jgi:ketosteroid isomerase-like protein